MDRWEYLVEKVNTEYVVDKDGNIDSSPEGNVILSSRLNDCGTKGWELVSFVPALPAQHFRGYPPNPYVVYAVFKRKTAAES